MAKRGASRRFGIASKCLGIGVVVVHSSDIGVPSKVVIGPTLELG